MLLVIFMSNKMIWKGEILWKTIIIANILLGAVGKSSNPYLKYTWEFIEIFAKGTLKRRR